MGQCKMHGTIVFGHAREDHTSFSICLCLYCIENLPHSVKRMLENTRAALCHTVYKDSPFLVVSLVFFQTHFTILTKV